MKVEKNLKKQIIIEILALLFLIIVIIYAMIAINKRPDWEFLVFLFVYRNTIIMYHTIKIMSNITM